MNMKKGLLASLVVLLAACNDSSNLEKVQSLPLSAQDKTTLVAALDQRPLCDKTTWTQTEATEKGGEGQVTYQCVLSATQTQALFDAQWATWVTRYQQRLAAAETLKTAALAGKEQASPALLDTAHAMFVQLRDSGDLARYKALISGSPVHNQPLDEVNAFFASEDGRIYLAESQGDAAPAASAALAAVTRAITAAGLATQSQDIDVCKTPALLVLAVALTPEEVQTGFAECRVALTSRHEADLASAETAIAAARARLATLDNKPQQVGLTETLTWRVPAEGAPTMMAHTVELSVKQGEETRRVVKPLALPDSGLLAVDFNSLYRDVQIGAMSDLVR